jgi:hypothetical protein
MNDWFLKKDFPLAAEVTDFVTDWVGSATSGWVYDPWQAPGSRSICIDIPNDLHARIQAVAQIPLYNEWYIWDFMSAKELVIHLDSNSTGDFRSLAFVVPVYGTFENRIYENDKTTVKDSVIYGVGDCLILNNSRYYHGGSVLSDTRMTLTCWVDIKQTDSTTTLEELLAEYKL